MTYADLLRAVANHLEIWEDEMRSTRGSADYDLAKTAKHFDVLSDLLDSLPKDPGWDDELTDDRNARNRDYYQDQLAEVVPSLIAPLSDP